MKNMALVVVVSPERDGNMISVSRLTSEREKPGSESPSFIHDNNRKHGGFSKVICVFVCSVCVLLRGRVTSAIEAPKIHTRESEFGYTYTAATPRFLILVERDP